MTTAPPPTTTTTTTATTAKKKKEKNNNKTPPSRRRRRHTRKRRRVSRLLLFDSFFPFFLVGWLVCLFLYLFASVRVGRVRPNPSSAGARRLKVRRWGGGGGGGGVANEESFSSTTTNLSSASLTFVVVCRSVGLFFARNLFLVAVAGSFPGEEMAITRRLPHRGPLLDPPGPPLPSFGWFYV